MQVCPFNSTIIHKAISRWKTIGIITALALGFINSSLDAGENKSQTPQVSAYSFRGSLDPAPFRNSWNFGFVPIDYQLIYSFPLRNLGVDSLKMLKIESNCECTIPRFSTSVLAPGDSSSAIVAFHTRDLYGPQNRTVEVHTSDPKTSLRVFSFSAIVGGRPPEVDMRPRSIFSLPGQIVDTIIVLNYLPDSLDFKIVYQDTSLFELKLERWRVASGEYFRIPVLIKADLPKGEYFSTFTLEFASDPPVRMSTPLKIIRY